MKHLIQRILKEEFNPDGLTSPEINRSPDTELHIATVSYTHLTLPTIYSV